jgi:septal ring factor EnvC (AmiA/AmiB activator)
VPNPEFPLSKIIGNINSMCLKCIPITLTEFYISNIERDIAQHKKELKECKNENDELRTQLTKLSRECEVAKAKAGAYETLLNKKLNITETRNMRNMFISSISFILSNQG